MQGRTLIKQNSRDKTKKQNMILNLFLKYTIFLLFTKKDINGTMNGI